MSYKEKIQALKLISEAYAIQDEKATSTIAIKQRERRKAKEKQEYEREQMEIEDDLAYEFRLYMRKVEKMEEAKERDRLRQERMMRELEEREEKQRGGPRTEAEREKQRKRRILIEIDRLADIKRYCKNGGERNYVTVLNYIEKQRLDQIMEKSLLGCFLTCGRRAKWPQTIYKLAKMTYNYFIELHDFVKSKHLYFAKIIRNEYPDGYDSEDALEINDRFMEMTETIFKTLLEILNIITKYDTHNHEIL